MKYNQGLQELIPFVPQDYAPQQRSQWQTNVSDPMNQNPLTYIAQQLVDPKAPKDFTSLMSGGFAGAESYKNYLDQQRQSQLNQYQDVQASELKNQEIGDKEAMDKLVYGAMQGDKGALKQVYDIDYKTGLEIENQLSLAESRKREMNINNYYGNMVESSSGKMQPDLVQRSPFLREVLGRVDWENVREPTPGQFGAQQGRIQSNFAKMNLASLIDDTLRVKEMLSRYPGDIPGFGEAAHKTPDVLYNLTADITNNPEMQEGKEVRQLIYGMLQNIRNDLYGAALTETERSDFERSYSSGNEKGIRIWIDRQVKALKSKATGTVAGAQPPVILEYFSLDSRNLDALDKLFGSELTGSIGGYFGDTEPQAPAQTQRQTAAQTEIVPTGGSVMPRDASTFKSGIPTANKDGFSINRQPVSSALSREEKLAIARGL